MMEEKDKSQTWQERMKWLIGRLNEAGKAYYSEDREIMSNYEYDALYDELKALEDKTGVVMADSPTIHVGYEAVGELEKIRHESPMLSLDKTKSREELKNWLNGHDGLLSWKEDGLTVVLTYRDGELFRGVTRGNGEVGEVVTNNVKVFKNIPSKIAFKGELIIRGEAVITYSDFEKVNATIPDTDAKYKNPRNLCSGSVRQLNNEITASRNVRMYIFTLVSAEGVDFSNSMEEQFRFLKEQGFETVEYERVNEDTILEAIARFEEKIPSNDIPSDGLVLSYDDLAYAASLGRTAKFPRGAIAFKWADETAETTLQKIEWNTSRTGLINPVAVFDPVELEGTTVSRASVHNVSIVKSLKLGIGDRIKVYKANMIIPQISENLTLSGNIEIPAHCPVCGGDTKINKEQDSEVLYCVNPDCPAKKLKAFVHFVERDAMNIEGLSEATLEKLIGAGLIHRFDDIFHLNEHREEILQMDGVQEKSCDNLLASIEKASDTTLQRILGAVGIPGVGTANAKVISRYFDHEPERLAEASGEELASIDGVGDVMAGSIREYFSDVDKKAGFDALIEVCHLHKPESNAGALNLEGMVVVITGSLEHFENRNSLKEEIERRGGKVTGSVTKKTTLLVNNDATSTSSKNKTAQSLGIPIVTEEEFMEKYLV